MLLCVWCEHISLSLCIYLIVYLGIVGESLASIVSLWLFNVLLFTAHQSPHVVSHLLLLLLRHGTWSWRSRLTALLVSTCLSLLMS